MVTTMKRKAHNAEFKFKVAIAAIRGEKTAADLCQEFGIVSSQLHKWKKELLENGAEVFKNTSSAQIISTAVSKKSETKILALPNIAAWHIQTIYA